MRRYRVRLPLKSGGKGAYIEIELLCGELGHLEGRERELVIEVLKDLLEYDPSAFLQLLYNSEPAAED